MPIKLRLLLFFSVVMVVLFRHSSVRGFVLVDVLMGITLSSVLVLLMGVFVTDTFRYRRFISAHQALRSEVFALASETIPELIREATAIDYQKSSKNVLSLYFDALEKDSWQITVDSFPEGETRLVLHKDSEAIPLSGSKTLIEDFQIFFPPHPAEDMEKISAKRAFQPMVKFEISATTQPLDGLDGFLSQPRVTYRSATTLRNYSLSNLRHSL